MMALMQISHLSKRYKNSQKLAVDDISFEVNEGEVFGFLGPNGAGKSTTIKCITGILPITEGQISICGHSIIDDPIQAKLNLGFVPDNHQMYEQLTAREYINFMADIYHVGKEDRKIRADKMLELFDLSSVVDNQISTFSHGMKQKICVIGALVHNPKLWILDEPLTGLDPKSSYELKELMKEHVKEGNSVFFSSHMLEVVEKVCDRISIINGGKLVMTGDLDEIKSKSSDSSLEEIFLSITGVKEEGSNSETKEEVKDVFANDTNK
ncbi:MAG: ABC transporter ATP-binding protein [Clostridiales bacterium]|nr:ABC transporter ATP-binding protein [Clostridiales bacterium]